MSDEYRIQAIEVSVKNPSTVVLAKNSPERLNLTSTSGVILGAAIAAFLSAATVNIETEDGSKVIKRINPFSRGAFEPLVFGDYYVNRLATQRNGEGTDHLEVLLKKLSDTFDKAYNVFDPMLQQMFSAAFNASTPGSINKPGVALWVSFSKDDIISARIGERSV